MEDRLGRGEYGVLVGRGADGDVHVHHGAQRQVLVGDFDEGRQRPGLRVYGGAEEQDRAGPPAAGEGVDLDGGRLPSRTWRRSSS